jgi:hypothetical protein
VNIFTCHAWLPDRRVVAGTDKGELIVIYQTNVQSTHPAFGSAEQYDYESDGKVAAILVDDRHVIAVSATNYIAVFEISTLVASTGVTSSTTSQRALNLKAKFRLGSGVNKIKGISLHKHLHPSLQSPVILLVASRTSLCTFEMIAAGATEGSSRVLEGTPVLARTVNPNATKLMKQSSAVTTKPPSNTVPVDQEWIDITGKAFYNFHGDHIDSFCVATRSSSFVTSSVLDKTVRVWDYTKPYDSSDMTEDYSDRGENMPFKVAMHPSGWTLACATKECILAEYAVTLSGLTLVRQVVNAKTPFISSDGTSYGNSAPISIVKYAYGGHLLAVVCGKLIQLFHMYHLDYSFSELSTEKQGKPKRVMTIAGHSTSINDVVFSSDDTTIFSCSLDGTVFR